MYHQLYLQLSHSEENRQENCYFWLDEVSFFIHLISSVVPGKPE